MAGVNADAMKRGTYVLVILVALAGLVVAVAARFLHHGLSARATPTHLEAMAARNVRHMVMPESARQDLLEWNPEMDASKFLGQVLSHEFPPSSLLNPNPAIQVTDDQPFNEYFLLRRLSEAGRH